MLRKFQMNNRKLEMKIRNEYKESVHINVYYFFCLNK